MPYASSRMILGISLFVGAAIVLASCETVVEMTDSQVIESVAEAADDGSEEDEADRSTEEDRSAEAEDPSAETDDPQEAQPEADEIRVTSEYVDDMEWIGSRYVTNYEEFDQALREASVPEADELETAEPAAFLIQIGDDIDDGFDANGRLEYDGDVDLFIIGTSDDLHTIDAKRESTILDLQGDSGLRRPETVYIERLRFTNAFHTDRADRPATLDGTAIHAQQLTDVRIYNSEFLENDADWDDDNGHLSHTVTGAVEVVDTLFEGNRARVRAAAIKALNDIEIRGSVFRDNRARHDSGAIHALGRMDISDSVFENNSAIRDNLSRGGAIHVRHGGSITDSEFRGNQASIGGAILYGEDQFQDFEVEHPLVIENSVFADNHGSLAADTRHTTRTAGAVYATSTDDEQQAVNIEIIDSRFRGNTVNSTDHNRYSGAVYTEIRDGNIEVAGSEFEANSEPVLFSRAGELIDRGDNEFRDNASPWD